MLFPSKSLHIVKILYNNITKICSGVMVVSSAKLDLGVMVVLLQKLANWKDIYKNMM